MESDRLRLTSEELDALRALVRWGTAPKAAQALSIPTATLNSRLDRIRDKTGCRHTVQLAAYAAQHGLLDDVGFVV